MAFFEKIRFIFENPKARYAAIVLISVIQGLIYVFIIPPWQHYDEPTHFEYAWLIADEKALPDNKAVDLTIRRQISGSMVENNFFDDLDFGPNLISEDPTWIGITQIRDPPGYYLSLALPLRLFKNLEVTSQLYVGRLVSMLFFLGTILIAAGLLSEFTELNPSLVWLVPLLIALTPSYADLMTALNNDVGATFVLSMFLLLGVKLIVKGFSIKIFALFFVFMFASIFTKNTIFIAIPLGLLLLFFLLLKKYWAFTQNYFFLLFGAATLVGGLVIFSGQDAAFWYRGNIKSAQPSPTRVFEESGTGSHAISIVADGKANQWLFQPIPPEITDELAGKEITLGAWIWASETATIQSPAIWQNRKSFSEPIQISTEPTFHTFSTRIKKDTTSLQVTLNPKPEGQAGEINIFYDDLVLVENNFSDTTIPNFEDEMNGTVRWNGEEMTNLLRNANAEEKWVVFRPQIYSAIERMLSNFPRYSLEGVQDIKTYGVFYKHTFINLFQSFWGRFGWNQIALPTLWYPMLAVLSLIGAASGIWKLRVKWPGLSSEHKLSLVWLGTAVAVVWLSAFLRTGLPMMNPNPFIPSARYAYPVMVPTMAFFVFGLISPFNGGKGERWWVASLIIFFVVLNSYSIYIIREFFK